MATIPSYTPKTPITRNYYGLAGVDFSTDSSLVSKNRSPQCVNMYKDYNSSLGQAVETRIGFSTLLTMGAPIYGIHFLKLDSLKVVVHAGNKLYLWENYPAHQTLDTMELIYSNMKDTKSTSFVYKSKLYILDGRNYIYYDGEKVDYVSNIAFIPTTSISRAPSGGGTLYQPVNLMQSKRKNSFCADGTSKDYTLDTSGLDAETITVQVDGVDKVEGTDFTVNRLTGVVTFTTAPIEPTTTGQDNVFITFSKTIVDYATRINKCILNCIYDNRVFFSGNSDYPNGLFNSQLDEPSYIPDTSYYQDGSDNVEITSLIRIGDSLVTLKKDDQQDAVVYYHTATEKGDETVYPTKQGLAGIGCISQFGAVNFLDEPVFISRRGLESFTKLNLGLERSIEHKSTLVDGKLVNEVNLEQIHLEKWRGYLLCSLNGKIYLADNRQKWNNQSSGTVEYEWYYWDNIGSYEDNNFYPATLLKEYDGELLFGTSNGCICKFIDTQYNDDGRLIYSCWTTPSDDFGSYNHVKTTNKRGGVANLKTLQNSVCKLSETTDKTNEKYITRYSASGFSFANIDFANFSFTTKDKSFMKYKIKEKKWTQIQLKFYSDEVNRPFGIFSATLEAFVGGYVKAINK